MRHLFILTLFLSQSLFGADVIGKIIALDGIVNAIAESGERILEKNSDIFVQETIVVGSNSRAQIQFTDGGLMNLIPDTEFRVNSYKYKKVFQKDASSSELVKGGFRYLSGSIAKKNPNEYEIKTPSATIGLRGTIVEALLILESLIVGVESGKALISNLAGSQLIGVGEPSQFVLVPGAKIHPALKVKRPDELERGLFLSPTGGLSIDQVQSDQNATIRPSGTSQGGSSTGSSSIGEAPDDSGWQFQPTGGGTSIQGGC